MSSITFLYIVKYSLYGYTTLFSNNLLRHNVLATEDLMMKKALFSRYSRSFKKWEIHKENNIAKADLRNQWNTGFRMENGAGKIGRGLSYHMKGMKSLVPCQESGQAIPSNVECFLQEQPSHHFFLLIFQCLQIQTQTHTHTFTLIPTK